MPARTTRPAADIWDAWTLGRALRDRKITRRDAHAQLDRIEIEVARRLEAARKIEAAFDAAFADAPGGLMVAGGDEIGAAWNAVHDTISALECDRSSAEFADGMDTTPEATRELIRQNID